MEESNTRWIQCFSNFKKALAKLMEAVQHINQNETEKSSSILYEILKEGLIQGFKYTYEAAWNVMKYFTKYQDNFDYKSSRNATREAFKIIVKTASLKLQWPF